MSGVGACVCLCIVDRRIMLIEIGCRLLSQWTEENQLKEAEIDILKKGNRVIDKIDAQYDALLKVRAFC